MPVLRVDWTVPNFQALHRIWSNTILQWNYVLELCFQSSIIACEGQSDGAPIYDARIGINDISPIISLFLPFQSLSWVSWYRKVRATSLHEHRSWFEPSTCRGFIHCASYHANNATMIRQYVWINRSRWLVHGKYLNISIQTQKFYPQTIAIYVAYHPGPLVSRDGETEKCQGVYSSIDDRTRLT